MPSVHQKNKRATHDTKRKKVKILFFTLIIKTYVAYNGMY